MIIGTHLSSWLAMATVAGLAVIIWHELMKWLFTKIIIIEDEDASEIKMIETDWDAIENDAREAMRLAALRKKFDKLTSDDNLNKKTKITKIKIKKDKSIKANKSAVKAKTGAAGQTARQTAVNEPQNDGAREIPIEEIYARKDGVIQLQDTIKLREEARDRELKKQAKEFVDWYEECTREKRRRGKNK